MQSNDKPISATQICVMGKNHLSSAKKATTDRKRKCFEKVFTVTITVLKKYNVTVPQ